MPKVILSRKGFDAVAGGAPSPIYPDATMVSLPIPEAGTGARYAALRTSSGVSYRAAMRRAGITSVVAGGRRRGLSPRLEAHLDPDLEPGTRPRPPRWRPAFGQAGAAQTILRRAGVGVGDLFLFFGWFRPVAGAEDLVGGRRDLHVIWGWLRVGAVIDAAHAPAGLAHHPHVVLPARANNTLYVAAVQAFPGVAGAGVLPYAEHRVLTAPGATRRADWLLPAALHPDAARLLDRHARRFGPVVDGAARFDARWQWQEFVADGGEELQRWAEATLRDDPPQAALAPPCFQGCGRCSSSAAAASDHSSSPACSCSTR